MENEKHPSKGVHDQVCLEDERLEQLIRDLGCTRESLDHQEELSRQADAAERARREKLARQARATAQREWIAIVLSIIALAASIAKQFLT